MAYYSLEASRYSGDGNAVFPDEIIIDDEVEGFIVNQRLLAAKRHKSDMVLLPAYKLRSIFFLQISLLRHVVVGRSLHVALHVMMQTR